MGPVSRMGETKEYCPHYWWALECEAGIWIKIGLWTCRSHREGRTETISKANHLMNLLAKWREWRHARRATFERMGKDTTRSYFHKQRCVRDDSRGRGCHTTMWSISSVGPGGGKIFDNHFPSNNTSPSRNCCLLTWFLSCLSIGRDVLGKLSA